MALGEGLSAADQHERTALQRQIGAYLQQFGLPLNRRGETALQRGQVPPFTNPGSSGVDAPALLASGELVALITQHDLVLDPAWARRFARYAQLQQAWDQQTVAIFVAPVGTQPTTRTPTFQSP